MVDPCRRHLIKLLSLLHVHLGLKYIIHQGIRFIRVLEKVRVFLVGSIDEGESQGEAHFDLDVVDVFDVDPEVLDVEGL